MVEGLRQLTGDLTSLSSALMTAVLPVCLEQRLMLAGSKQGATLAFCDLLRIKMRSYRA